MYNLNEVAVNLHLIETIYALIAPVKNIGAVHGVSHIVSMRCKFTATSFKLYIIC